MPELVSSVRHRSKVWRRNQQVTDLLANGRMETTITRCKQLPAEKMGKMGDHRQALSFITKTCCQQACSTPLNMRRNGGYTRIIRLRRGDVAETAIIGVK